MIIKINLSPSEANELLFYLSDKACTTTEQPIQSALLKTSDAINKAISPPNKSLYLTGEIQILDWIDNGKTKE